MAVPRTARNAPNQTHLMASCYYMIGNISLPIDTIQSRQSILSYMVKYFANFCFLYLSLTSILFIYFSSESTMKPWLLDSYVLLDFTQVCLGKALYTLEIVSSYIIFSVESFLLQFKGCCCRFFFFLFFFWHFIETSWTSQRIYWFNWGQ